MENLQYYLLEINSTQIALKECFEKIENVKQSLNVASPGSPEFERLLMEMSQVNRDFGQIHTSAQTLARQTYTFLSDFTRDLRADGIPAPSLTECIELPVDFTAANVLLRVLDQLSDYGTEIEKTIVQFTRAELQRALDDIQAKFTHLQDLDNSLTANLDLAMKVRHQKLEESVESGPVFQLLAITYGLVDFVFDDRLRQCDQNIQNLLADYRLLSPDVTTHQEQLYEGLRVRQQTAKPVNQSTSYSLLELRAQLIALHHLATDQEDTDHLLDEAAANLQVSVQNVDNHTRFRDFALQAQYLQERHTLLLDSERFLQQCQHDFQAAKEQLFDRWDTLVRDAQAQLAEMPPQIDETAQLMALLEVPADEVRQNLPQYLSYLEHQIEQNRQVHFRILADYETFRETDRYFETPSEADTIGYALKMVADLDDYYTDRLWTIGEDVLARLVVSDLNPEPFYEKYGYDIIARALKAAHQQHKFLQTLGFLEKFLPPAGNNKQEAITQLLDTAAIKELFLDLVRSLHLKPADIENLDSPHYNAILTLLEYADLDLFPQQYQLQWSALLHRAIPEDDHLHYRASYVYLLVLLRTGHFIGAYYTLQYLVFIHPSLCEMDELRSMLKPLIECALALGPTSRGFLIEMCTNPCVNQLSQGDFGTEFLIAALTHYTQVNFNVARLINYAWPFWNQLQTEYPFLSNLLEKQLTGQDSLFAVSTTIEEQKNDLNRLIRRLGDRLVLPSYRGVRIAISIHNWYINKYMRNWFEMLQESTLTQDTLDRLESKVLELQQIENLVEACPIQHDPPVLGGTKLHPIAIPSPLNDQVNNRLFELLSLFEQAIQLQKQLMIQSSGDNLPEEELRNEIAHLSTRSSYVEWALEHLLEPRLPFIGALRPE